MSIMLTFDKSVGPCYLVYSQLHVLKAKHVWRMACMFPALSKYVVKNTHVCF